MCAYEKVIDAIFDTISKKQAMKLISIDFPDQVMHFDISYNDNK